MPALCQISFTGAENKKLYFQLLPFVGVIGWYTYLIMQSIQANAPLLEEVDKNDDSDSSSTHAEPVDSHVERGEITPQEPAEPDVKVNAFKCCGCSPTVMICISHALSAWGDRMWMYAISIFLIALTPGSFLFTAIYGLAVSLSVVALGTLVGDWIDITPRLKAVRLTLIIQNVAVVACAVIVLIMFEQKVSSPIFIVLAVVLVLLAIVARLSSLGTTIAIERDWVVVIAKEDAFLLAGTNSILRRIDLTCNILAPVSTGLILDYGSTLIGVLFIAGWNLISVFVEYTMLSAVYRSCQGLASKAVDVNRFESTLSNSDPDLVNVDLSENDQDGTLLVPRVKTGRSLRMSCGSLLEKIKSRVRILRFGLKVFFQQRVAFAGIGLACLYLTVLGFDSITTAYAYSQHVSAMALGFLTGAGALTGILGTFIFPKFRQMFGLVKTGLISNAIQLFFLMLCVASVWAPGHPGHLLDPNYHGDGTGKMTKFANVSILPTENLVNTTSTIPWTIASTIRPTPTVHLSPTPNKSSLSTLSKNIKPSMTIPVSPSTTITNLTKTRNNKKNTKHSGDSEENNSLISLGLLMGGIVMSRIGLWMTDLVITQLFQENVPEQERGIVSGVQNSFNSIMDVAHFVLVTVAPKPEEFGVLILISVIMVSIGFAFYSRFAWNHRKRLIQLEKLSHWSASNESVEGTSQRLRDESRSNSRTDLSSGVLSVKNDNYSLES